MSAYRATLAVFNSRALCELFGEFVSLPDGHTFTVRVNLRHLCHEARSRILRCILRLKTLLCVWHISQFLY